MATVLNLNTKSQKALKSLLSLSGSQIDELAAFLAENLEKLGESADALALSNDIKGVPHEVAYPLLDFFAPFCMQRLSAARDYKELVDAVLQNFSRLGEDGNLTAVEQKKLKSQLHTIFSNPTLALKSKGVRLQSDHDKVFKSAELLSDIRPIFSVNGKPTIEAAVTFQNLKIQYFEDGQVRYFYCALDSKDLESVKDVVDHALKKQKALLDMLGKAGVSTFKVE